MNKLVLVFISIFVNNSALANWDELMVQVLKTVGDTTVVCANQINNVSIASILEKKSATVFTAWNGAQGRLVLMPAGDMVLSFAVSKNPVTGAPPVLDIESLRCFTNENYTF